ncbi:glycoside hydrolase family 6 protein, partial [Streptomyces sp. NRRL S-481]
MYGSRGAGAFAARRVSAVVLGAALLVTGCSSGGEGGSDKGGDAGAGITQQPKETAPFWVNPEGTAAQQLVNLEKSGKKQDAEQIRKIAEQPVAEWIGPDNPQEQTRGLTEAAEKAGRTALLVLYNIPHRDCGQYSQGGAADGNAYREWL